MDFPRRFVFRGNASGVSAHIRRPESCMLPVQAACSLPVVGGISESKAGAASLGNYLRFESAHTYANGGYVDDVAAEALTHGNLPDDKVPTKTVVTARTTGLHVGRRFSVGIVDAGLVSYSPRDGSTQPSIQLVGNRIDQVRVDGSILQITLDENTCSVHDTMEALIEKYPALGDRQAMFARPADVKDSGALFVSNGTAYATIVKDMQWLGREPKGAKISGNVLTLDDFGAVFFGELLISELSRRLTMIRMQLGSQVGGSASASEVESNGVRVP